MLERETGAFYVPFGLTFSAHVLLAKVLIYGIIPYMNIQSLTEYSLKLTDCSYHNYQSSASPKWRVLVIHTLLRLLGKTDDMLKVRSMGDEKTDCSTYLTKLTKGNCYNPSASRHMFRVDCVTKWLNGNYSKEQCLTSDHETRLSVVTICSNHVLRDCGALSLVRIFNASSWASPRAEPQFHVGEAHPLSDLPARTDILFCAKACDGTERRINMLDDLYTEDDGKHANGGALCTKGVLYVTCRPTDGRRGEGWLGPNVKSLQRREVRNVNDII
jgi:hypothetical protein